MALRPHPDPEKEATGHGKELLRQARAGNVDMVIADLVMPEREGIESIQALRREAPGVRILAICGAFKKRFLSMARVPGADAVTSKPAGSDQLLDKVAEILAACG